MSDTTVGSNGTAPDPSWPYGPAPGYPETQREAEENPPVYTGSDSIETAVPRDDKYDINPNN